MWSQRQRRCLSLNGRGTAKFLLGAMMGFIGQHALRGRATAPALLPAEFLEPGARNIGAAFLARFDFIQQQLAREEAVQALLARALALDL
ncbi:MAG TPA: hypothetical protein VGF13_15415, partial [Verrucomicrobiae bacterium]